MKKAFIFKSLFLLTGILFFMGAEAPLLWAKTTSLSYSIFFPAAHDQCKIGEAWAKEVEKESQGKIKINVFPGGTLTGAKDCYNGVINGISDIGMSCFAYTRGRFPVMEALDLPLGYKSGTEATRVANAFYQKIMPKELKGVKVLYLHAHGPGFLHTQTPVRNLSDLKRMKIRSTGLSAKVVKSLGGVPVAMPQPSTYEALSKGVVEGTFGPIEVLKGWKQGEVIKSTTECTDIGYTTTMFVVMNLAKWNALPDDLKKVLESVSAKWIDVHGRAWDQGDENGRAYSQSLKNTTISLSESEGKKWKHAVAPVIDNYVKATQAKNLDAQHYITTLKALLNTPQ